MSGLFQSFLRDRNGGPAAEFALVLPLLLIFLFGIIDVGRLMWTWNQAEKATQMGARYAVVTQMVPSGLASYSFAVDGGIPQGDPVDATSFPGVSCTSAGCTCQGSCAFPLTANTTAFNNIVGRMQAFKPDVTAANVTIDYDYSGLGFAGDPNGPDVAPLVTIRLRNLNFTPITLLVFQPTITLPEFRTSLTMEDSRGAQSN